MAVLEPDALVALGATAARGLFGSAFRLSEHRGQRLPWPPAKGPYAQVEATLGYALSTIHPSAVVRGDPQSRHARYDGLVSDLRLLTSAGAPVRG